MSDSTLAPLQQSAPTWASRLRQARADLLLGALTLALLLLGRNGWPQALSGVHVVLGTAAVLWLPGYMLTLVVFPGRRQLTGTERAALSIAFSVGVLALFALLLSRTHLGLRTDSMLSLLSAWFLLTALIDQVNIGVHPGERYRLNFQHPHTRRGAALGGALTLALIVLTSLVQALQPPSGVSELMALGPNGTLDGYTTRVQAGSHVRIPVRFQYRGTAPASFQLAANSGPTVDTGTLRPGQSWNGQVEVIVPQVLGTTEIKILLSGRASSEEHRELHLEVEVVPAS